jgi:uncharacterized protein (DUF427 family)
MARRTKTPGALHPITLEPNPRRVVVRAGGRVIADSRSALTLREAAYSPVQYIPIEDVDQNALRPSSNKTYCPYKGEASYYSIAVTDTGTGEPSEIPDAVWTYEQPYEAVHEIASHVAFYPDRVQISVEE